MSNLIIDVAVVHEFRGSVAQAANHGQLRHPNADKVLIDKAVTKATPIIQFTTVAKAMPTIQFTYIITTRLFCR